MSGPVIGKCEACDNELHAAGEESWNGANYCELPLAPGVTAKVCAKGLGRGGEPSTRPKGSCARLVRQRRSLCPGCGKSRHSGRGTSPDMTYLGVLCEKCHAAIARDTKAQSHEVSWYTVKSFGLIPYLNDAKTLDAARALAEGVAGSRRWQKSSGEIYAPNHIAAPQKHMPSSLAADPIVELHAEQAEALRRFLGFVYEVLDAERKKGFEEGENVLKRLAGGDFTPLNLKPWGSR